MTFLTTLTTWQWALALGVPIAITFLYFLRLRRTPLVVPSTLVWRKSIEDLRVNSPWQRLRRNVLLLLQLLAAAGLILALLRPTSVASTTGKRVLVFIDNSASMASTDGEPTRLDAAKRIATHQIVDQMHAGDEAMVVAFSDVAGVVVSWTEDRPSLRRAIRAVEQTDRPTDLAAALALLPSVLGAGADNDISERAGASVCLISDGAFPAVAESLDTPLEFISVGRETENVGIVSLSMAPRPSDGRRRLFARVRNFGDAQIDAAVELWSEDARVDLRRVSVAAGESAGVLFVLPEDVGKRIRVRLDSADAFPTDDVAYLVTSPQRKCRVLRFGPPNAALDAALDTQAVRSLASVQSHPAAAAKQDESYADDADLIIFDRCSPTTDPSADTWYLAALPPGSPVPWSDVEMPMLLDWNSSHPSMRFLHIEDVRFLRAKTLMSPPSAGGAKGGRAPIQPIIETDRGILLYAVSRGVYSDLVFGSSLVDDAGSWSTDWPLKASFPLFVMNVLQSRGTEKSDSPPAGVRTDGILALRSAEAADVATLRLPNGTQRTVSAVVPGRFEFGDLRNAGFYQWSVAKERNWAAVNLFNEAESRIAPAQSVALGSGSAPAKAKAAQGVREWWKWPAAAALVVLGVEWYVYNRRVSL